MSPPAEVDRDLADLTQDLLEMIRSKNYPEIWNSYIYAHLAMALLEEYRIADTSPQDHRRFHRGDAEWQEQQTKHCTVQVQRQRGEHGAPEQSSVGGLLGICGVGLVRMVWPSCETCELSLLAPASSPGSCPGGGGCAPG